MKSRRPTSNRLQTAIHGLCGAAGLLVALVLFWSPPVRAEQGSRLGQLVRHPVSRVGARGIEGVNTVIGAIGTHRALAGETLLDVARDYGLGYNEVVLANPRIDPWVIPEGEELLIPSEWILPEGHYAGLVLNIPEMRLFYYQPGGGSRRSVVTFPVGLGRQDWQTPQGKFRIRGKTENPTWVIPESIRKERLEEDGLTETFIPGGAPDNPLGKYRLGGNLTIAWGATLTLAPGVPLTTGSEEAMIALSDVICISPESVSWLDN